jgi:UDP-glucose 4-epimerase
MRLRYSDSPHSEVGSLHYARFVEGSLSNSSDVAHVLVDCGAVMHFAGKSLVGRSVEQPELYS